MSCQTIDRLRNEINDSSLNPDEIIDSSLNPGYETREIPTRGIGIPASDACDLIWHWTLIGKYMFCYIVQYFWFVHACTV